MIDFGSFKYINRDQIMFNGYNDWNYGGGSDCWLIPVIMTMIDFGDDDGGDWWWLS